jgi:uncharacterized protein YkwD
MASRNILEHSSGRNHIGENIARRVSKSNSVELMINGWISEKEDYVHKAYPYCSKTGDKSDVGHYTQIIWQATTEVGCGFAKGSGKDYLVCQYKTSGNRSGKYAYEEKTAVEIPVVETPVVETPVVQTPVVETPVVEVIVVETPTGQTPVIEVPVVQTPVVQTPVVQTPVETEPETNESTDPFIAQCLKTHNDERTPLGIPKLVWSAELAQSALKWAKELARRNTLKHSSGRVHIGENVSCTGTKSNSLARLLGMWMDEKKYYIHKPYPNCSNTGDKSDVGHYTQVIWKDSKELGCGLATGSGRDFLVCQYKTSGNRQGKYAY